MTRTPRSVTNLVFSCSCALGLPLPGSRASPLPSLCLSLPQAAFRHGGVSCYGCELTSGPCSCRLRWCLATTTDPTHDEWLSFTARVPGDSGCVPRFPRIEQQAGISRLHPPRLGSAPKYQTTTSIIEQVVFSHDRGGQATKARFQQGRISDMLALLVVV